MIDIKQLAASFAAAARGGTLQRVQYCSGCARRGQSVVVEPTTVLKSDQRITFHAWGCPECIAEADRSRDRRRENAQRESFKTAGESRGLRRHPGAMR